MYGIRNYGNTRKELHIVETRLTELIRRKDELYQRLCVPKGWQISEGGGVSTKTPQSGVEKFVTLCNTPSEATGLSLNDEIERCEQEVAQLRDLCQAMETLLMELQGIEATLYRLVVIDGKTPTEAVREVSESMYLSESNIWHTYYKGIKPYIDEMTVK